MSQHQRRVSDGHLTVIITAGGHGRRLWPLSIAERPKPFCELLGGKTFLQHSFRLACELTTPDHVFVVTSRTCTQLVRDDLPQLPSENLVLEPLVRGTTAAIGLATLHIARRFPQSICVVLASDHYHPDPDFAQFSDAIDAARAGPHLVSIGVVPTFPHTGYGYMQCGPEWRGNRGVQLGLAYHEKPDVDTAQGYIDEGNWLWNANIFVWSISSILSAYAHCAPEVLNKLEGYVRAVPEDDLPRANRMFGDITSLSIDYEIMEKVTPNSPIRHLFVAYDGRWSDVGTFAVLRALLRQPDGNSYSGAIVASGTRNCLLVCEHPYRLVVDELKDLDIVVNHKGDLLIRQAPDVDVMRGIEKMGIKAVEDQPTSVSRRKPLARRLSDQPAHGECRSRSGLIILDRVANVDVLINDLEISVVRKAAVSSTPIDLRIAPDSQSAAEHSAELLIESLRETLSKQEKSIFVPSVGRTTRELFRILRESHRNSCDWSRVVVVQMDEYVGISSDDPQSFCFRLREELLGPLGIAEFLSVNDQSGNQKQPPDRYEAAVEALGGIDVILHGIGRNGHLGFNEPGTLFDDPSGNRPLRPETLEANFAGAGWPKGFAGNGFTLSLGAMARARRAILLALGPEKHFAIRRAIDDPSGPDLPATILQHHGNATYVMDRGAYFGTPISDAVRPSRTATVTMNERV